MMPIVFCPLLEETKGSQSLGSPSPCPPPNAQHIGRSQGHWKTGGFIDVDGGRKGPQEHRGLNQSADA
jgi:hypothetical protein